MTLPAFLFGVLVSTLMGAVFHLWKDGGLGRLLIYVILAWIGFWAGHILGVSMGWTFLSIGPLSFRHRGYHRLAGAVRRSLAQPDPPG